MKHSYTTEQFIEKAKIVHGDRFDYSQTEYINNNFKVKILCPRHGYFEQRPSTHLEGQGCPVCKKSKGELKIEQWLIKNHVSYIPQKTFPECRGKKYPLRFDFYLPEYNICIEFDGNQHFSRYPFFIKNPILVDLKYAEIKAHDKTKTDFCSSKDIKLIRLKHKQSINKALFNLMKRAA
jgi:hypothetical protein